MALRMAIWIGYPDSFPDCYPDSFPDEAQGRTNFSFSLGTVFLITNIEMLYR